MAQHLLPDRQPAGLQWDTAAHLACVLASTPLHWALQRHLAGADDAAVLRVLKSAVAALPDLPQGCAAGETQGRDATLALLANAVGLMALAARLAMQRQLKRQAASLLLLLLPQLASALQLAATEEDREQDPLAGRKDAVLGLCHNWTVTIDSAFKCLPNANGAEVAAVEPPPVVWCAGAVEALRALPLAAAAAACLDQPAEPALHAVHALCHSILRLAWGVADVGAHVNFSCDVLHHTGGSATAASNPSAHPAKVAAEAGARELYASACRLAHWAASQPDALRRLLPAEQPLLELLPLLSRSFVSVVPTLGKPWDM
ncbi:hypothetical protein ABPG75_003372 [Micractinium tetrahymenae]